LKLFTAIYHSFLVLMMLPFSLIGRIFYRRKSDGVQFASSKQGLKGINPINEISTDDEEEIAEDVEPNNANHLIQSQIVPFKSSEYKEVQV